MSFFDTPDSFASSGSSGFSSGGDAFASSSPPSFASSPSSFASSPSADSFASNGSSATGFSSPSHDNFAASKKDHFASSDSKTNNDAYNNTGKSGGFFGFLRKTFDAFASSSNVDDTFATGALDDAFATDRHEKEQAKYKAFFSTPSLIEMKNTYGNNPTTIITGIGYGKFGNKLK